MSFVGNPIEKILPLTSRGVLSFVGGGGKTSLMFHLARLLAGEGRKVLTTTTTKIFFPSAAESETVLVDNDPSVILRQAAAALERGNHVTAAARVIDVGKLKGFAPEVMQIFADSGHFDWILVEADGSARRPLKAPDDHEPVIPANSNIVIAVAGLEVLGSPLTEALVFRAALAGARMGLAEREPITEVALARLIAHPLGSFKGTPRSAARFLFLNKADSPARCEAASRIAALLKQAPHPVAEALLVGQALASIAVHSVYPLRGGP